MSQNYNASIKFSCNPGNQFVFLDRQNLIRNNSTINDLSPDSEISEKNSINKIKLKDVLTMSFKCSYDGKWVAVHRMVKTYNFNCIQAKNVRYLLLEDIINANIHFIDEQYIK